MNNIIKTLKAPREQREIDYWNKKYDIALIGFEQASLKYDSDGIEEIKRKIENFKERYPFYAVLLNLIETEHNQDTLKSRIVQAIISYLDIAYQKGEFFIEGEYYRYRSKKAYSTEIKLIRKDLNSMIYYAFTINYYQRKTPSENDFNTKTELNEAQERTNIKSGRKPYSKLAVIALKYIIISKFIIEENPHSDNSRFPSVTAFYKHVADIEGLNKDSFSNKYKEIRKENIEIYCKSNPNVVEALIGLNCFSDNKECSDFLSKFDTNMK